MKTLSRDEMKNVKAGRVSEGKACNVCCWADDFDYSNCSDPTWGPSKDCTAGAIKTPCVLAWA